jgi:UDP-glucose 4-epimerase
MKLLVTVGAGYIGSAMTAQLFEAGSAALVYNEFTPPENLA